MLRLALAGALPLLLLPLLTRGANPREPLPALQADAEPTGAATAAGLSTAPLSDAVQWGEPMLNFGGGAAQTSFVEAGFEPMLKFGIAPHEAAMPQDDAAVVAGPMGMFGGGPFAPFDFFNPPPPPLKILPRGEPFTPGAREQQALMTAGAGPMAGPFPFDPWASPPPPKTFPRGEPFTPGDSEQQALTMTAEGSVPERRHNKAQLVWLGFCYLAGTLISFGDAPSPPPEGHAHRMNTVWRELAVGRRF